MANSKNITFDQLQNALSRVKTALDGKANTSHGNHVPKTETANNARFLRNDNTWQTITPVNIGAADRSHNHTSLTGVTSLQFAAGSSDSAVMKVTTESANTYLDFEMNDDAGSDMYRWRFSAYDSAGATPYFNLMTLTAKDTTSARLTVNGDVTASSFTGNATSATKLQTARALKIGNTSKNFDGTGNVTWTLSEIGAAASSHGTHVTYATAVPLADGTAAVGTSSKVAREDHVHPIQTTVTGNAGTATKLQTARTLTIGNKGKTFDGSANVTWTLSEIGAAASGHTHNKITSRGKVASETTTTRPAVDGISMSEAYDNGYPTTYGNVITLKGQGDGQILVGWSGSSGKHAPVYVRSKRDVGDANWSGWAQFYTSANPQPSVSGNAGTATKLQTGRSFTIGNTSRTFDGSANVAWSLNDIGAAALSHTHNYVPLSNNSTTKIVADSDASNTDEYAQLQAGHNYLRVTSSGGGGTVTQGADKLTFNGNVVYHAGRKPTPSEIGAAASSHGTHVSYATATPLVAGTGAVGTSGKVAREDHVHPAQTSVSGSSGSCTGNAATATKLQTARKLTIGNTGKTFNGTADVAWSLSEIGAASSGHSHTNINFLDKRSENTTPANVSNGVSLHLKSAGTAELNDGGSYYASLFLKPWNDISRGPYANIAVTGNQNMWVRTATSDSAWNSWKQIAFTSSSITGNAASATKLQNARNIKIGNTTRSFNGTADVSWTLSDIGAAASNHTHELVNLNSEAFSGRNDLNTYNSTKTWVARTLNSTTNKPADYFTVVNFGANSNSNFQLAHSYANDSTLYVRGRHDTSGNYTPWAKIYTDKNKPTASEIGAAAASHTHNYAGSSSAGGNANAAVKLATPRSINGTNFDGSGNITTANWGTGRTITIGNKGKTVNGGGNVTWTWNEMGVPKSQGNYRFGGNQNAITTAQFITLITNAGAFNQFYWISRGTWNYAGNQYINDTGCGNIHLAGCTVECIGSSSSYTIRVHTPTTSSSGVTYGDFIYVNNGKDYSPGWRRLYSNKYKPTPADIGAAASSHTHNYAGSSSAGGNANAAVKLATARTLTIGNKGKNFDGSGNVSWSLSEIGALPTAGGTVSGNLNVTGAFSIGGKKITINSSAPSSPAVGDIWIKI